LLVAGCWLLVAGCWLLVAGQRNITASAVKRFFTRSQLPVTSNRI